MNEACPDCVGGGGRDVNIAHNFYRIRFGALAVDKSYCEGASAGVLVDKLRGCLIVSYHGFAEQVFISRELSGFVVNQGEAWSLSAAD